MQPTIATLLVLLQAYLVAEYSDQSLFLVGVGVLLMMSYFVRVSISFAFYVFLLTAIAAGVTTYYLSYPVEISNDWILSGTVLVPVSAALIGAQLVELFFDPSRSQTEHTSPQVVSKRFIGFALGGFLSCYCRKESTDNSTTFFLIAIAVAILALSLSVGARSKSSLTPRLNIFRSIVFSIATLCIIFGTRMAADSAKASTALVRGLVNDQVAKIVVPEIQGVGFNVSGTLESISNHKAINPDETAVTVTCDAIPGYLRGRVFDRWTGVRWTNDDIKNTRTIDALPVVPAGPFASQTSELYNLFDVTQAAAPQEADQFQLRSLRIANNKSEKVKQLLLPLSSRFIEGRGDAIKLGQSDVLLDGLSYQHDYFSHVPLYPKPVEISPDRFEVLTSIPKLIRRKIEKLALQVGARGSSDAEKMREVEKYFRSNYQYSLESESINTMDRISYFILNRPPAHCEYFATAAVIFLRLNGIPARYVVGFGVDEPSTSDDSSGDIWIGKNRDAHAWVEAYDRQKKRWAIVEATPGMNLPKSVWNSTISSSSTGGATGLGEDHQTNEGPDFFTRLQSQFNQFVSAYTITIGIAFLALALIALLALNLRVFGATNQSYQLASRAKRLRQLDRRLRKIDLVRRPSETLHQFSNRLSQVDGADHLWVRQAANDYREYAMERYAV